MNTKTTAADIDDGEEIDRVDPDLAQDDDDEEFEQKLLEMLAADDGGDDAVFSGPVKEKETATISVEDGLDLVSKVTTERGVKRRSDALGEDDAPKGEDSQPGAGAEDPAAESAASEPVDPSTPPEAMNADRVNGLQRDYCHWVHLQLPITAGGAQQTIDLMNFKATVPFILIRPYNSINPAWPWYTAETLTNFDLRDLQGRMFQLSNIATMTPAMQDFWWERDWRKQFLFWRDMFAFRHTAALFNWYIISPCNTPYEAVNHGIVNGVMTLGQRNQLRFTVTAPAASTVLQVFAPRYATCIQDHAGQLQYVSLPT